MNRSEICIWKCNGCSQQLPRHTKFNTWLQGRTSDHKKASARCSSCHDKDEVTKKHMQRATTSMVMQRQTQDTDNSSTQTTQVNIKCPQCRRQTSIDMAKFWAANGRNRFAIHNCIVCKTTSRFGTWFRCKGKKDQTISVWLSAIECLSIVQKPEAMHVDLFNCNASREFEAIKGEHANTTRC